MTPPQLSDPFTLPTCPTCTLPNRIAKAALTEGLATPDGMATPQLCRLYGLWSDGGAGLLLTGNILIDRDHLERPGNVVLHGGVAGSPAATAALRAWTTAGTRQQNHMWAQLSHGGRQVQRSVNPHPKAPSAVPLGIPGGKFGLPEALAAEGIEEVIAAFATAAKTCQDNGFTGVQIHAAHGYLLSSFLNPRANQRTDAFGGTLERRASVLLQVVERVRANVGPNFPICVQLNSADFQKGGFQFEDSLQVVQWLEAAGVDMIEISGGN